MNGNPVYASMIILQSIADEGLTDTLAILFHRFSPL
jgi:hypothetical protein